MRALYTGSFDPVTNGHLDVIRRIVPLVESLVVAVAVNVRKRPAFSVEERVAFLSETCRDWRQVEIRVFDGLVVDAAREVDATFIIRGIRDADELPREMHMAQMNRALTGVETLFIPADPSWGFVSSSAVKEVARFGGDVSPFVPASIVEQVRQRMAHVRP